MRKRHGRLVFGKVKHNFTPQDVRCPYCAGLGIVRDGLSELRSLDCIACDRTGKRDVCAARILSGEVIINDRGFPEYADKVQFPDGGF